MRDCEREESSSYVFYVRNMTERHLDYSLLEEKTKKQVKPNPNQTKTKITNNKKTTTKQKNPTKPPR